MNVSEKDMEHWTFYREVVDALPFYVMIIDETHHIIAANEAVRNVLNVDPDKIVGKFCPKEVHGLDSPYPGCPLEEAAEKGHSVVKELFDDGSQRWAESAAFLTNKLTKDGKRIFIHTIRDIDDRKKSEEKVKQKIKELEQWQKLTVGRENRMVDLKIEIKELKEKLSRYEIQIK